MNAPTEAKIRCPKCGNHQEVEFKYAVSESAPSGGDEVENVIDNPRSAAAWKREAERYKDGFTVMLAAGLQNGFFKPGEQMTHRVIEWLQAVPMRDGVTVESALDAAIDAAKEKANG